MVQWRQGFGGGREVGQFAEHQKNNDQFARSSLAGSGRDRSYGEFQPQ